jgi:hypothetical protein
LGNEHLSTEKVENATGLEVSRKSCSTGMRAKKMLKRGRRLTHDDPPLKRDEKKALSLSMDQISLLNKPILITFLARIWTKIWS